MMTYRQLLIAITPPCSQEPANTETGEKRLQNSSAGKKHFGKNLLQSENKGFRILSHKNDASGKKYKQMLS